MLGVIIHSHCVRVGARVRIDIFVAISTVTDTYDENTQLNPVKPVPGRTITAVNRPMAGVLQCRPLKTSDPA